MSTRATSPPPTPVMPEIQDFDDPSPVSAADVSSAGVEALATAAAQANAGDERWEVEKVLGVREAGDGSIEFHIRWKGYGQEDDSWECADDVGADPIAAFYGWAPAEKAHERFTHTHHPKLGAAQPDWRRKTAVKQAGNKKPKYSKRLVPDKDEKEENRGWKAQQLKHDNHLKFKEINRCCRELHREPWFT